MSYILDFKSWDKIFEADAISNTSYTIAFTGSTPSKAPNKSALAEFMNVSKAPVLDSESMDDTKAISKVSTDGKSYQVKVVPKSLKATNYLKLGDKVLIGDDGKGATITVTKEELMRNTYEASGNGIFSLGRALALLPKLINGQQIIIGMNNPTANSFIANAKTGMQDIQGKFANSCLSTLIVSKAIIPSESNVTNNVTVYRNLSNKSEYIDLAKKRANIDAMPFLTLTPEMKTKLTESFTIDISAIVDSIKDKKLTRYDEATKGLINDYVNQVFEKHVNTVVDRFKKYLEISAASAGVTSTVFAGIYGYLDTWKKTELAKKQEYLQECQSRVMSVFAAMSDGKPSYRNAATANAKVIKGTEGKL